uniref:Uncharacterized protein n=2 Tax=Glossina austeni TaxID=7395 RepID=A0A1A9UGU1_GLOAU
MEHGWMDEHLYMRKNFNLSDNRLWTLQTQSQTNMFPFILLSLELQKFNHGDSLFVNSTKKVSSSNSYSNSNSDSNSNKSFDLNLMNLCWLVTMVVVIVRSKKQSSMQQICDHKQQQRAEERSYNRTHNTKATFALKFPDAIEICHPSFYSPPPTVKTSKQV